MQQLVHPDQTQGCRCNSKVLQCCLCCCTCCVFASVLFACFYFFADGSIEHLSSIICRGADYAHHVAMLKQMAAAVMS